MDPKSIDEASFSQHFTKNQLNPLKFKRGIKCTVG